MRRQIFIFKNCDYFYIFTLQALNKKESKGGGVGSPGGGDDSDHEGDFQLTPRTEAKYNKIDEEFQLMMQHRNQQISGSRVSLGAVHIVYCVRFAKCWHLGVIPLHRQKIYSAAGNITFPSPTWEVSQAVYFFGRWSGTYPVFACAYHWWYWL